MISAVRVENLAGLERAFKAADKEEAKRLRTTLKDAAEPVKATAQGLAVAKIRRMHFSSRWAEMRVGQARAVVYMVPKEKGRRSKTNPRIRRSNIKPLLLDRAMQPALDQHRDEVVHRVENMLETVGAKWQTTP